MLQPGMCSATWSLSSTWAGWPGAAATQAANCHPWRSRQQAGGRGLVYFAQGVVGGLRGAIGIGDAERPVLDLGAAGVPVVGPGKDERPGQARERGLAQVAGEKLRLHRLAV